MRAGRLRHRVDIQRRASVQDEESGQMVPGWATAWDKCPADFTPVSGREFIAGQGTQNEVIARIVIRYRAGVTDDMRVLYRGVIYGIQAVLPDAGSGLEYLTLAVCAGVNKGDS